jgi:hypothetical protein
MSTTPIVNVISGVGDVVLATATPVEPFPNATVALFVPELARLNVCARPGTTMSSAVARNRTVFLKYVLAASMIFPQPD